MMEYQEYQYDNSEEDRARLAIVWRAIYRCLVVIWAIVAILVFSLAEGAHKAWGLIPALLSLRYVYLLFKLQDKEEEDKELPPLGTNELYHVRGQPGVVADAMGKVHERDDYGNYRDVTDDLGRGVYVSREKLIY